jgi:hypothetical protein
MNSTPTRPVTSRIRAPVKRQNAQNYLLLTVMSFAASVVLTRLFLMLTGFPKIGEGEFHVAHVLWGGLLLFVAALLPLVFANRWVYTVSALLNGLGVGLFIDEVGKFITQNNDYFYPLAAPIIYGFFLITVLIYFQVRRPPSQNARAELYRALDMFQEMLDHDLDEQERADLETQLQHVIQHADQPDQARLASVLTDFLAADTLYLAPDVPTLWERLVQRGRAFEARWIGPRRLKVIIISGLGLFSFVAVAEPAVILLGLFSPGALEDIARHLIEQGQVTGLYSLQWFFVGQALQGVVGIVLLAAALLMFTGRDRRGSQLGYFGLLASLTSVNLLTLYYNQFGNLLLIVIEFGLLLALLHYRRRYLRQRTPAGEESDS